MPDNKRIAKNALALTIRMVIVTAVGLFTSRIVLQTLGVDDYGIYGVIGGVVGIAAFLNRSMAGATSRFLTFELGRGNMARLKRIFSISLIIHFIIACIVAVLAETLGLWFVNHKMNFPPGSMFAVNVLYQFSVVSMFVTFTQVPYTAAIIANERMGIYAYFEMANVVLKLAAVYLLVVIPHNRLIVYGALTLGVTIISAAFYRIYCLRNFPECRFKFVWDKPVIKEMVTYSGLDFYRQMSITIRNQANPIILNIFFGIVVNAAASLATTVAGAIEGLSTSISQAYSPPIIKSYANGRILEMESAMCRSAQFTSLAMSAIAIPFIFETHNVLYLWLGEVPPYSVGFFRLIAVNQLIFTIMPAAISAIQATGNIKKLSFVNGTLYLLVPFISYIILKTEWTSPFVIYLTDIAITVMVVAATTRFVALQIPQFRILKFIWAVCRSFIAILIASAPVYLLVTNGFLDFGHGWLPQFSSVLAVLGAYTCALIPLTLTLVLTKTERTFLKTKLVSLLHRKNPQ